MGAGIWRPPGSTPPGMRPDPVWRCERLWFSSVFLAGPPAGFRVSHVLARSGAVQRRVIYSDGYHQALWVVAAAPVRRSATLVLFEGCWPD